MAPAPPPVTTAQIFWRFLRFRMDSYIAANPLPSADAAADAEDEVKVAASRLTKVYHRRWHKGHGRSYALMRDEEVERASARLFDVPSHMYRQAAASAAGWLWHTARGRGAQAFACEARLHFIAGFFRQRRADRRPDGAAFGAS